MSLLWRGPVVPVPAYGLAALLSRAQLLEIALAGCEASSEIQNRVYAILAAQQRVVEGVLLSSDLLKTWFNFMAHRQARKTSHSASVMLPMPMLFLPRQSARPAAPGVSRRGYTGCPIPFPAQWGVILVDEPARATLWYDAGRPCRAPVHWGGVLLPGAGLLTGR
eukprot:scaffold129225_cov66-Phaeocystis_antarctica.AAC.3